MSKKAKYRVFSRPVLEIKEWPRARSFRFHFSEKPKKVDNVDILYIQCVCRQSVKAYLKYLWLKLRQANSIYHFPAQNGRRKCMIMVDNIGNVSDMGRPSTFTKDQMVDIVLCLGELKNVFKVRRKFAKHYGIACHSRKVPAIRILPNSPRQIQWDRFHAGPGGNQTCRGQREEARGGVYRVWWGTLWALAKKAKNEAAEE